MTEMAAGNAITGAYHFADIGAISCSDYDSRRMRIKPIVWLVYT